MDALYLGSAGARADAVAVRRNGFGRGVYITADRTAHETIARASGPVRPTRTRFSLQVGWRLHLEVGPPLRFVNHSCEPNCYAVLPLDGTRVEIRALRDLEAGSEVLLDYDTFEYEMSYFPPVCRCGSPRCRGSIRGYRYLSEERKAACRSFIAEYLRTEASDRPVAAAPVRAVRS